MKQKLTKNKIVNLTFVIVLLIIIYITFKKRIDITLMFLFYDIYALFGLYWHFEPEYCSNMKYGFTPVMPLNYYAEFNKAIFPRIPSGDNTLNMENVKNICDKNFRWLQKNGTVHSKPKGIAVFHVNQPDFKEKIMQYIKNDYPFVIRGVNLKCFETMQIDNIMKIAGNNKVYMSPGADENCPDNIFTELKNIFENKCYITNSTNLFYYYKDLLPDSDMDIIKNMIDGYMSNNSKQLFLSVVKGNGTALHAAYTNNFYLMIQGEKKWTFFNPNQLALLYPSFQKKGIYMASESRFLNMDTYELLDKFPLLKYAQRYEVELQERDILYNPMSWFHSVYNKTDVSVACSTRWSKPLSIPDRHMLRYGHMINPELRNYVKDIFINTGVLGISQIDEHKHMIGENNPDAIPYWDKYTNDSHKLCADEDCSVNWHR
jgi:hypothetical protein